MTAEGPVTCVECGKSFDLTPREGQITFTMPSLLDPTDYACSVACFKLWKAKKWENEPIEPDLPFEQHLGPVSARLARKSAKNSQKAAKNGQNPLF